MKRFRFSVAAVASLSAAPALAADEEDVRHVPGKKVEKAAQGEFTTFDAEADRPTPPDEFHEPVESWFNAYDESGIALVDEEDLAKIGYDAMNLNGDGEVTVDEWNTWVDRHTDGAAMNLSVADWDENGDGVISNREFDEQVRKLGWLALPLNDSGEDMADEKNYRERVAPGEYPWDKAPSPKDPRPGEDEPG